MRSPCLSRRRRKDFEGYRCSGVVYDLLCETPIRGRAGVSAAMAAFFAAARMSKLCPQALRDRAGDIRRLVAGEGSAAVVAFDPAVLEELKENLCDLIDEVEIFVSQGQPGTGPADSPRAAARHRVRCRLPGSG